MADPGDPGDPGSRRRNSASRNKSFRKARDAGEYEIQAFRDVALEDLQKYFSPDTWKKMTDLHLQSAEKLRREGEPSSVQKYFEPAQWEKLQRLGVLKPHHGRPLSYTEGVSVAKNCLSPRTWDALVALNVVPTAESPDTKRRPQPGEEGTASGEDDEHDDLLVDGMDDCYSLANAVTLEGVEEPSVETRLRQYFSDRHWKVLEDRGVVQNALSRLGKETSV